LIGVWLLVQVQPGRPIKKERVLSRPDKLTDAEHAIVVKGTQAAFLLSQEAFQQAINDLGQEITDKLLNTEMSETKTREELFHLHKALQYLVATLQQAVAHKETVEHNALETELAEQEDESDTQE
jgi:hypothetical protein